jgi:hypothetical protein
METTWDQNECWTSRFAATSSTANCREVLGLLRQVTGTT